MSNITYKTITSLEEAKSAWLELSPNYYLHDDWNFRYLYYKYWDFPIHFFVAYDNNELVALLPLMHNGINGKLEFFAGFDYMENNRIFVKPGYEYLKQELINNLSLPYRLDYMDDSMKDIKGSEIHDENYFVDLSGLNSYQDFIEKYLSSKTKSNLKSQINKITSEAGYKYYLSNNIKEDLNLLREFSLLRFGEKSSYFDRPYWKEYIEEVSENFDVRVVVAEINNKKVGVGLAINYNNITYGINTGYDQSIRSIGKLITLLKINQATQDGMKTYDSLGGGAYGWKSDFNLLTRPFYLLESN